MSKCDGCRLCGIVSQAMAERDATDTLLRETQHFEWVPGLGAFVEGYSLLVSKEHVLNTGALPLEQIDELAVFAHEVRALLQNVYGKESHG